jgi:hypothetical protein
MTIRLWPFYVWFHATSYQGRSQGGRWYDNNPKPGSPEWVSAPPRDVTGFVTFRFGFTWSVKKTFRGDHLDQPSAYLVLGSEDE